MQLLTSRIITNGQAFLSWGLQKLGVYCDYTHLHNYAFSHWRDICLCARGVEIFLMHVFSPIVAAFVSFLSFNWLQSKIEWQYFCFYEKGEELYNTNIVPIIH